MARKRMIRSLEFKNGKTIDKGCVPMTKHEIACFDRYERDTKEGKLISYSFEPNDLWMKLSIDVKKDRRGNIVVNIKEAKRGYCHRWECNRKAKKNYVLCTKHLKLRKKK